MNQITPRELAVRMRSDKAPVVLDVRENWELELARLDDAINIPMAQVPEETDRLRTVQSDRDLVVMCHSGKRSQVIVNYLQQNGFERVLNLSGGINGWSEQVDQSVPLY